MSEYVGRLGLRCVALLNDGTEERADEIMRWATPLVPGQVFAVPHTETGLWLVVIENLDHVVAIGANEYAVLMNGAFYKIDARVFSVLFGAVAT